MLCLLDIVIFKHHSVSVAHQGSTLLQSNIYLYFYSTLGSCIDILCLMRYFRVCINVLSLYLGRFHGDQELATLYRYSLCAYSRASPFKHMKYTSSFLFCIIHILQVGRGQDTLLIDQNRDSGYTLLLSFLSSVIPVLQDSVT